MTASQSHDANSVVLVGIDLSDSSGTILRAAAALARQRRAELHLVHVVAHAMSESTATLSADRPLEFASEADRPHTLLERLGKEVADLVPRVVLHTRVGRPDKAIAQLARDVGADILVVGAGSPGRFERLMLGSVADSLVRHAPCAVLAYRRKCAPAWAEIAPPCHDCTAVQEATAGARLWCDRHSERHPPAHTYSEVPPTYGIGAQTFREG
jgi:nucleotide-binding universal stress UspA family protein